MIVNRSALAGWVKSWAAEPPQQESSQGCCDERDRDADERKVEKADRVLSARRPQHDQSRDGAWNGQVSRKS